MCGCGPRERENDSQLVTKVFECRVITKCLRDVAAKVVERERCEAITPCIDETSSLIVRKRLRFADLRLCDFVVADACGQHGVCIDDCSYRDALVARFRVNCNRVT